MTARTIREYVRTFLLVHLMEQLRIGIPGQVNAKAFLVIE